MPKQHPGFYKFLFFTLIILGTVLDLIRDAQIDENFWLVFIEFYSTIAIYGKITVWYNHGKLEMCIRSSNIFI